MKQINIYSGENVISRVVFGSCGSGTSEESDCSGSSCDSGIPCGSACAGAAGAVQDDCAEVCRCLPSGCRVFAVIDRKALAASAFVASLAGTLTEKGAEIRLIDASEEAKTMDTVLGLCGWLIECGADRNAFLLAVGGGITTDMSGFAASIYKRGIRFAYVPTTLLSQVDAAVGGKTGVNFDRYKNMLGVIRQPEFTYVASEVLASLPARDFLSGASEMLKSFVIEDGGNYAKAVALLTKWYSRAVTGTDKPVLTDPQTIKDRRTVSPDVMPAQMPERKQLQELVEAAVKVKAGIVSRDQFEGGERRKLNLGHTFAHAVETLARRKEVDITHGEAVSMGMVLAARLGARLGISESGLDVIILNDLKACGLPVDCPFPIEEMSAVMQKDKKAEGGKIHFIIPRAIGDVVMEDLTVDEACRLLA